jgi:hypothetical protein
VLVTIDLTTEDLDLLRGLSSHLSRELHYPAEATRLDVLGGLLSLGFRVRAAMEAVLLTPALESTERPRRGGPLWEERHERPRRGRSRPSWEDVVLPVASSMIDTPGSGPEPAPAPTIGPERDLDLEGN